MLPVKLQPGRVYATWINVDNFQNVQDESSRPALPYLLIFETGRPGTSTADSPAK